MIRTFRSRRKRIIFSCRVKPQRGIANALSPDLTEKFRNAHFMSTNIGGDASYYTVAITGASGMLGTALIDELSRQRNGVGGKRIRIVKLIRSNDTVAERSLSFEDSSSISTLPWNPNGPADDGASRVVIDPESLEEIDTIVHLAGENVGTSLGPLGSLGIRPWSPEKKDRILQSRIEPTMALAAAIANSFKPKTFIVASGVGIYGNHFMGDSSLPPADESNDVAQTSGFMAHVSREWEAASQRAATDKHRVVNIRLAPVMSRRGGALAKLYPVFLLGGGGVVGSGKQHFAYVSAKDAVRAIVHIMNDPSMKGPVNICAPVSCTNAEFTEALGKILSRPTILPLPEIMVKVMFGEMGEEMLLGGIKVKPTRLLDSGFVFEHETIDLALESAMKETF